VTPTTAELLAGNMKALASPPPPEASGDFAGGMVGVTAMISVLAAQEAERGAAVRVAENAAIRALLTRAGRGEAATADDGDLSITALDAANATLGGR
jgi:hypothetical protein